MAELYLSVIKSAGMIPIAGWAARFYGKSSHGLWMLDKSALFIHKSLKKNQLCIFRCDGNPLLPTKKERNPTRFDPMGVYFSACFFSNAATGNLWRFRTNSTHA